ncbi:hypothetical protein GJU93_05880 [Brucella sp. 10RB9212]|uniref:glycosyl hydrolase family 28-related protein n=1 Tax=unclassified Brucella TaxID=2632610 RepID=UPI000972B67E|nr:MULTISPECIES: glycosyl hydrolase family 28-related protein [unclassified Brucella]APY13157.1 hypothetical protein BKD02_01550 [Brucella sp. 09RB8910]MRN46120.1 hypothetical protein [Brucella sp. 10RB9212]
MSTEVRWRRGSAAEHASFIGAPSEFTHDQTNNAIRVHDGLTPGGHRTLMERDLDPVSGEVQSRKFTPPTAGFIERTVESKLNDVFDARDFGVTADGSTGISAMLNIAIATVAAIGGGRINLPTGIMIADAPIVMRSQVTLIGQGIDATIIKAKNALNAPIITTLNTNTLWDGMSEDGEQFWGLEMLTLDGNKTNQASGDGIKTYSRAFLWRWVKITHCKERGVNTQWGDGASWDDPDARVDDPFMEASVENLFVSYCDKEGVYYDGPHDGRFYNVQAALNSHTAAGTFDGIVIGPRAGGHMGTQCHSWGDTQRHAYTILATSTHFANCEADDAAVSLVHVNGKDFTWIGAVQIGGHYSSPPSASDLALKGFTFGTGAARPFIVTAVRNCPGGAIDFTDLGNDVGRIVMNANLDAPLQSVATGVTTHGYVGAAPSNVNFSLSSTGYDDAGLANISRAALTTVAGTASFPAYVSNLSPATGMFFPNQYHVGLSAYGTEALRIMRDNVIRLIPRTGDPTADTWIKGMMYFSETTGRPRYYNGTAWVDI